MALISLTLTGFIGIRDGMGRETISIDFRQLTGDARLVAIVGDNGRGKTTILDNMTCYPVMPSKAGRDGLGAFSYYDEVYLPENHKILVWDQGGKVYRKHLVIRLGAKRRTEAYLHVRHGGEWKPVRIPDGTVSDGKMETYTRCIEHVAGPEAVFLTTCFAAQNRRPLSKYDNAEIKALFGELLALSEIRDLGLRAAETAKLLRTGLLPLRQQRQLRHDELASLERECAVLSEEAGRAEALRQMLRQSKAQLARACTARAELAAQATYDGRLQAQRQGLQHEREQAVMDHRSAMLSFQQREERSLAQEKALERAAADRAESRRRSLAAYDQQRAILADLRDQRDRVLHAMHAVPRRQMVVEGRQRQAAAVQAKVDLAARLTAELSHVQHNIAANEHAAGKAVLHCADLKRRFGLTAEVPCSGTDLQPRCKLLADAHAARPLIPSAEGEVERLAQARDRLQQDAGKLAAELQSLGTPAALLSTLSRKLQCAEQRLRATTALAARWPDVEAAGGQLAIVEAQIATLHDEVQGEDAHVMAQRQSLFAERADLRQQQATQTMTFDAALAKIDTSIAALPPAFDSRALTTAEQHVVQALATVDRYEQELATATANSQRHEALNARMLALRQAIVEIDQQLARIEASCTVWATCSKALGNDGVIALSIEDAGPELSALTNDLLAACYGPRFTASLKTQVASAKGELGEGFAIIVHDANSGRSKNLTKMSGGERVWINESLTRAMALYLARKSATRSDTLFSDEADGALSPGHKRMFIAMKRAVLNIGEYHQEFFITHTPELVELADAVIDLDQYASEACSSQRVSASEALLYDDQYC